MNIYVFVEGERATKRLYKAWIPLVNKKLKPVDDLRELDLDNFFVFAGHGYPGYWDKIRSSIYDVNEMEKFDRLVIGVDSEEYSFEEKLNEVRSFVDGVGCRAKVLYVIQHFSLETWLLGNLQTFRKRPQDTELKEYIDIFDVHSNDPELLTGHNEKAWNRSQFAYRYLRAGIRDKYGRRESYNKHDPGIAKREEYFYQVKKRCEIASHIVSFRGFLDAFS